MRLHRLALKDFRGIREREIEFADSGITVVEGANEAGKSSMIEALDLLLRTQASSRSAAVKAVQPAGRDVGSEVRAEISCGPWRFEYFKRFNSRPETTLTILEPRREQLTGREAHERVQQILDQSLDNALYLALRLLQSQAPDLDRLADSSALARALDRVAAPAETDTGDGDADATALIEAAAAEYRRYYTPAAGRPAKELAEAISAAKAARAVVDERTALLRSAEQAAAELPAVETEYAETVRAEAHAVEEAADLARRAAEAETVDATVRQARAEAEQRALAVQIAERAGAERAQTHDRLADLDRRVEADGTAVRELREAAEAADTSARELEEALARSRSELGRVRSELAASTAAEKARADRARIAWIDAAVSEAAALTDARTEAVAAIAANPVTDREVAAAATLDREIAAAQARVDAGAAAVEVTRLGDGAVTIDGAEIDDSESFAAVGETVVQSSGVRVVVRGAADTVALADRLSDLQAQASALLARCETDHLGGVAGRAAARAAAERALQAADAARQRALAGATVEELQTERAALVAGLPAASDDPAPRPVAELRPREAELTDLITRAERKATQQRTVATTQRARAEAQAEAAERARATAKAERAALLEQRAQLSDERLAADLTAARDAHDRTRAVLAEREAAAAKADSAGLRAACAEAEQKLERVRHRLTGLRDQRTQLRTLLEQCRTENRLDDLADAQTTAAVTEAEHARVAERAAGARLLYETLVRKRTESRSRYVAPFTRRLEELAAPVFGETVRFEVDDDFAIARRTLDGVTVDVEALSGGAREQLGLIARLACAMIVDENDGVPVILDDALGYSDPDRLASMAQVLGSAADDAQIIVLTCSPDRYAAVPDATVVAV
ncbi:AAA family ATPase [Gordonia caeni]|uniref:ATP-binding protein n=1 Tax=Gordonia caeni TaxID=1007097 RepID=A0ABP7P9L7_9ACTN